MCTSKQLAALLQQYMYRQTCRYEDDITQLNNNVTFRKADPVDHLEMIMSQTRAATAQKIFDDIRMIIAISRGI